MAQNSSAFVMGDQLSPDISSLRDVKNVVMAESARKCGSGRWHKRRVAFIVSAMRHFKNELQDLGYDVDYYEWSPDLTTALREHVAREHVGKLYVMKPRNLGALMFLDSLGKRLGVDVEVTENDRFMCPEAEFLRWLEGRKQPRMENFYRMMRRTRGVLMDGDEPAGGKWNYDRENRRPPAGYRHARPGPECADDAITRRAIKEVLRRFPDNFGELESLHYPADRKGALEKEKRFIDQDLALFGPYEDAMLSDDNVLRHSRASMLMNVGLLSPHECVAMAEEAYREGAVPINSAEGYVRQILGWREFMGGMYSAKARQMRDFNYFNCERKLPRLYWDESLTRMNCMRQAVKAVRTTGYTHHIIRLMVLGNFALLAGIRPQELSDWFLTVYEDAYPWVVEPNVICLSQYADGGGVAMKPYVSSAAYINKMSDYCHSCLYSPHERTTAKACPFNYLYWDFMDRNKKQLMRSCQMTLPERALERIAPETRHIYRDKSRHFLRSLDANNIANPIKKLR